MGNDQLPATPVTTLLPVTRPSLGWRGDGVSCSILLCFSVMLLRRRVCGESVLPWKIVTLLETTIFRGCTLRGPLMSLPCLDSFYPGPYGVAVLGLWLGVLIPDASPEGTGA